MKKHNRRPKTIVFIEMKDGKVIHRHVEEGIESIEEATSRAKRESKQRDRDRLNKKLNATGRAVLLKLRELVDKLGEAGVDISYFPEKADMQLLKYAKKIQTIADRKRPIDKPFPKIPNDTI